MNTTNYMNTHNFTFITGKTETHGGASNATKARTFYSVLGIMEGTVTREQIKNYATKSYKAVSDDGISMLVLFAIFSGIIFWLINKDIDAAFFLLALIGGAIVIFSFAISKLIKAFKRKQHIAKMTEDEIVEAFAEEAAISNTISELYQKNPTQKDVSVNMYAYEVHKAAQGIFESSPFTGSEFTCSQLENEMKLAAEVFLNAQQEVSKKSAEE